MYGRPYIVRIVFAIYVWCTIPNERSIPQGCLVRWRRCKSMASDVAARDNYLTLALFSRRIIEALKDLVLKKKRDRLKSALPAAIESLEAATDSRRLSGFG